MGNRLPYLDIHSGELTQFLTQLVGDFTPCPAMVQRVWHLEFRDVYAQGVLVKFGSARLAGHPLYLRYRHDDALGLAAHGIALVERYSRQRAEIDGKRSFIERGQETSAQREEQCDADRKESTGAPEDYFRMGQRGTQGARIEGTEFTRQPGLAVELPPPFTGTQKIAAKHRCHRQRHDRRGYQRHNEGDAERHKHPPLDSGEEEERQETRHDDQRGIEDGHAHLL